MDGGGRPRREQAVEGNAGSELPKDRMGDHEPIAAPELIPSLQPSPGGRGSVHARCDKRQPTGWGNQ